MCSRPLVSFPGTKSSRDNKHQARDQGLRSISAGRAGSARSQKHPVRGVHAHVGTEAGTACVTSERDEVDGTVCDVVRTTAGICRCGQE